MTEQERLEAHQRHVEAGYCPSVHGSSKSFCSFRADHRLSGTLHFVEGAGATPNFYWDAAESEAGI